MLATPRYPQSALSPSSEDSLQYRPAKDLESFNNLLPPPVEFVEGSSSGSLAVAEGKYEPINATPKTSKPERSESHPKSSSSSSPSTPTPAPKHVKSSINGVTPATAKPSKTLSLHSGEIDLTWPKGVSIGSGLFNSGNTCFLNSALQCLLHTPPLLHILNSHRSEACKAKSSSIFCMTCSLREVAVRSHTNNRAHNPSPISNRLTTIAKHMRKGRQEDSHEFLRYAVDALQKACLAGLPPKIDPKVAETTWVHKIFGGRLRSRVTCGSCGYNSDTFDSILDLSIDIYNAQTLKDALRRFVAPDYLKGTDKYKCEKCKRHVNAEKRFTIHDSPAILTVQLKRFSPLGNKISQPVAYDETLSTQPYMSDGQYGATYSLYGVICHAGGGPHSGHYYAFVKSKDRKWYEMNDESVTLAPNPPTRLRNAYILFYIRNKGQMLQSTVHSVPTSTPTALSFTPIHKPGIVATMKKRPREESENDGGEDQGVKVDKPFIGPLLPSQAPSTPDSNKRQKLDQQDPQATSVKKKIDALKATEALSSLKGYASGSDDDAPPAEESTKLNGTTSSSALPSERAVTPPRPASTTSKSYVPAPISPSKFFSKPKQRHQNHSWGSKQNGFSPFSRLGGGKKITTYGKKSRPI